jgi:hypothetical protein
MISQSRHHLSTALFIPVKLATHFARQLDARPLLVALQNATPKTNHTLMESNVGGMTGT